MEGVIVYLYQKNHSYTIAPVLPNTGVASTTGDIVVEMLLIIGAGYFIITNKKAKKTMLIVGTVITGLFASTIAVSSAILSEVATLSHTDYCDYLGHIVTEETTTETTVHTTTVESTTQEVTTE